MGDNARSSPRLPGGVRVYPAGGSCANVFGGCTHAIVPGSRAHEMTFTSIKRQGERI